MQNLPKWNQNALHSRNLADIIEEQLCSKFQKSRVAGGIYDSGKYM